MIPTCWPDHPHLVHEIAVLADQRRRASIDTTSNTLEEWHRYCLPSFLDRLKSRTKQSCDEQHGRCPAAARYRRYERDEGARGALFQADVVTALPAPRRPEHPRGRLGLVDPDTRLTIDPATGELL